MLQEFWAQNDLVGGNPAGGNVKLYEPIKDQGEPVLYIKWQEGPLGRGKDRLEPNGAFVETVIAAAKQRIEFYQTASEGKFACQENEIAIGMLQNALDVLDKRTKRRETAGVEGTHKGS